MEREKLIKGLIYIAIIIILCTVASRVLFKSGETLQEYAQNNPELAYAVNEDVENDTENDNVDDVDTDVINGADNNTDDDVSDNVVQPDDSDAATEEFISPDRVVYQENFYYEPLSEELRLYITGTSFPAGTLHSIINENKELNVSEDVLSSEDASIEGTGTENIDMEITYDDLSYIHIMHYNFDGEVTEGELICNKAIAQDLVEIFYELYKAEYQIEKIRLIDEYGGDDNLSMEDNNTSCFNYRVVEGSSKLSKHAYGLAIDINPFYNPYVRYNDDGSLHIDPIGSEPYADRSAAFPYKIDSDDLCLKLFKEHGFTWGGDWNSMKDYQHFQKVIE